MIYSSQARVASYHCSSSVKISFCMCLLCVPARSNDGDRINLKTAGRRPKVEGQARFAATPYREFSVNKIKGLRYLGFADLCLE